MIPTSNRPDYLVDAIESALLQTVPCEVIVVDHGSAPMTEEVASRYSAAVRYLRLPIDYGPHFAWLHGTLAATGEFVKFLWDDDTLAPEFTQEALKLFAPEVGFVFCQAEIFTDESGVVGTLFTKFFPSSGVYRKPADKKRIARTLISPGAMMLRRADVLDALYQGNLPFQENSYHGVGPDHFMKLLLLIRYPAFGFLNRPYASFRSHPGSITADALADAGRRAALDRAYDEVFAYYRVLRVARLWFALRKVLRSRKLRFSRRPPGPL